MFFFNPNFPTGSWNQILCSPFLLYLSQRSENRLISLISGGAGFKTQVGPTNFFFTAQHINYQFMIKNQ
jgi:hypothetical protein